MRKALTEHIRKKLSDLMKNIKWNDHIKNLLLAAGIFGDNDVQIIEAKDTDFGKSSKMLEFLVTRRDIAYVTCMEILDEVGQHDAFDILEEGLKSQADLWKAYVDKKNSDGDNLSKEQGAQIGNAGMTSLTTSSTPGKISATSPSSTEAAESANEPKPN